MDPIQKARDLKAKQKELFNKAKAENRNLSEEEKKQFDDFQKEIDDCLAMAELENTMNANDSVLGTPAPDNQGTPAVAPDNAMQPTPNTRVVNENRWGRGPNNGMGEFLKAVAHASVNGGVTDERLAPQNAALGSNITNPDEGGFVVPEEMLEGIDKKTFDASQLAQRCERRTLSRGNTFTWNEIKSDSRVDGSRWGGILGYWVEEAGTITATNQKIRKRRIELDKVAALTYATSEQLEDAVAMTDSFQNDVPQELAFQVDEKILTGNGAGVPLGIDNSEAGITVAKRSGQEAASVVWENVSDMWARQWARSRQSSIWLINQEVEPELDTMAQVIGTGGVPVYLPANGAAGPGFSTLKGRPVIVDEHCEAVGTAGDIRLLDLSQYRLVTKGGINMAMSIHVQFLTDQSAFRWTWRVGGAPRWKAPLTPYKGTKTYSPFVNLATRS